MVVLNLSMHFESRICSVGSPPNIKGYKTEYFALHFLNIKLLLNDYLIGKKEYINYLNSVTINNKSIMM
jgi:hypothetical protein